MFTGYDMLNAPFFIKEYDSIDVAFKAFSENKLLKKEFTTILDKSNITQQLSDWLILVKLVQTIENRNAKPKTQINCVVNEDLAHLLVKDSDEFMITRTDEFSYKLSTSLNFDSITYYGSVSIAHAISENITGMFWDMFMSCKQFLSEDDFNELFRQLYNLNYASYIDYQQLEGEWTAVEDLNPMWFADPEIEEAHDHPSRYIAFLDNKIILGGSVCGTIKTSRAHVDKKTNVIYLNELVIARITKFDGEDLQIEYYYCYDWMHDGLEAIPEESSIEYLCKCNHKSEYRFNRLKRSVQQKL